MVSTTEPPLPEGPFLSLMPPAAIEGRGLGRGPVPSIDFDMLWTRSIVVQLSLLNTPMTNNGRRGSYLRGSLPHRGRRRRPVIR